ncbi:AAA family ATPase [Paraburkholderia sp.]|uniref:AAA family ATPase n=1 Tax=Paraburkholderia sp. TaxID=1926495 RepID=UPI0039E6EAC2
MTAVSLCGAHRTGKTTLAKAYALKSGCLFLETSVSAINRELGFDLSKEHSFSERLAHQELILERIDRIYAQHAGEDFITDRSPLDMIAYTMAEAINDRVAPEDQERFARYVQKCIDVTNRRFGILMLVQPGIALREEEGKAATNAAYIEHLNSIILGLTVDERVDTAHFYIPRHMRDLKDRVEAVEYAVRRGVARALAVREAHVDSGMSLH